jgi:uncharacterized protein
MYSDEVSCIEDLKVGMRLPGTVTNVTNFGAFVDIGVHQDGLVHISQLSNIYVSDPNKVVKVQQQVMVTVTEVDIARKRIALSMKDQVQKMDGANAGSHYNKKDQPSSNYAARIEALKNRFK